MVSGLKVNFFKSKLYGINISGEFMLAASQFLFCCIDQIPFKFLGIQVGINPRRCCAWKSVVEGLKKRMSGWKARSLSIGGRVTMINAILNSVPVYVMSFYKAPKKIIKQIIQIQSRFLWLGNEDKRGIAWVSWDNVCRPKEEGGLGVKHIETFNSTLLCKWKWRMLKEETAIWKDILQTRYEDLTIRNMQDVQASKIKKSSIWWRDVVSAGRVVLADKTCADIFMIKVKYKVGSGEKTVFWHNIWIGDKPLKEEFHEVYAKVVNKLGRVCELWKSAPLVWKWDLGISKEVLISMNGTAARQLKELEEILEEIEIRQEQQDTIWWWPEQDGIFSVKSFYDRARKKVTTNDELQVEQTHYLKHIWKG
ncbi:unnamed protein product [Vicia faba]|uniref:Uncharacterized protein n=1 Tax=Vicia faba TaxID=3906 RepID=A0AAV1ATS8_VICFA|nr:unnamed protein product [Vicia faba]